jgi:hypothetical protein
LKTYHIDIQRLRAATQAHGLVEVAVDAQVTSRPPGDTLAPATVLSLSEANARVLLALLKGQLADVDKRKARSQR